MKKTTSKNIDRFGLPTPGGAVAHIRRDGTISYFFPDSVVAVKNKNKYGRYLSWQYTYHYNDPGTPSYWRPGTYRCTGQGIFRQCVQTPSVFVKGRPAGPRSSSMIWVTRSPPMTLESNRSVLSGVPTSEPVEDICSANST